MIGIREIGTVTFVWLATPATVETPQAPPVEPKGPPPLKGWKPGERVPVSLKQVGFCPAGTACIHCQKTDGEISRVVDASVVGCKSEPLHWECAQAWFDKIRP